jgi:hypothetical protein
MAVHHPACPARQPATPRRRVVLISVPRRDADQRLSLAYSLLARTVDAPTAQTGTVAQRLLPAQQSVEVQP